MKTNHNILVGGAHSDDTIVDHWDNEILKNNLYFQIPKKAIGGGKIFKIIPTRFVQKKKNR